MFYHILENIEYEMILTPINEEYVILSTFFREIEKLKHNKVYIYIYKPFHKLRHAIVDLHSILIIICYLYNTIYLFIVNI